MNSTKQTTQSERQPHLTRSIEPTCKRAGRAGQRPWLGSILPTLWGVLALGGAYPAMAYSKVESLTLDRLMQIVARTHPKLAQASAKAKVAEAEIRVARGAFDPKVSVEATAVPVGYEKYGQVAAQIKQQTPYWGLTAFAGYRWGWGDFPVYKGEQVTGSAGEVQVGLALPLWANRSIDPERAYRQQSRFRYRQARCGQNETALDVFKDAAEAYWSWTESGAVVEVQRELLEVAQERDTALRERSRLGAVAPIVVLDNQRIILSRQSKLIEAERKLASAALKLSLYFRDTNGKPQVAAIEQLPNFSLLHAHANPPPITATLMGPATKEPRSEVKAGDAAATNSAVGPGPNPDPSAISNTTQAGVQPNTQPKAGRDSGQSEGRAQSQKEVHATSENLPKIPDAVMREAILGRPQLCRIEMELKDLRVQIDVAKNQVAPDLDVRAYVTHELGDTYRKPPTDVALGLQFSMPVGLRKAKAKRDAAQAKLNALSAQRRGIWDRLFAQAKMASVDVSAAHRQMTLAGEQVDVSRQVARAERQKFADGASDLVVVNLREQAVAAARRAEIKAWTSYEKSIVAQNRALGWVPTERAKWLARPSSSVDAAP